MLLEEILLWVVFVTILFITVLIFIAKKQDKKIKELFQGKKLHHYDFKTDKLEEIVKEIDGLNVLERLWLLRHIMGSSYRAIIVCNAHGLSIEGVGEIQTKADEPEAETIAM